MKLPDGNKPIKIGDASFIYKGVYNPIYWVGKDPYRPRVETLVIKDGRYLYANIKDNIDLVPPDKRTHNYSIPGGSLDADSTKIQQAEAETNEEALVKVTLLYHSGISYYDLYEPGFILKGGDTPLEYVGSISDVYVGVYDGPYDKSLVEEKDLDPEMAEHGKFHDIKSIAKYLRKEHIEALIHSQFVADDVKATLRFMRSDIINESSSPIVVPDKYIYHGSTCRITEFKPMSLDLGNAMDEPGWSTFCFGDYESARLFGFMRALSNLMEDVDHDEIHPRFKNGNIEISREDLNKYKKNHELDRECELFVHTIDSTGLNIGIGNDPTLKEYTFRETGVKPVSVDRLLLSMLDLKENIQIVDNYDDPMDTSDYKTLQTHDYQSENEVRDALTKAIKDGKLNPGDDIQKYMDEHDISFKSDDISLPEIVFDIDEPVLETLDSSNIVTEESYPLDCYGLPERKAYPMPDEKHVRSAIRFFNYANKEEEKELADKINEKIKEFKMKDVSVGDKNRFKKYYRPIVESYSLQDFHDAMKTVVEQIQDKNTPVEKRYALYEQSKGIVRMMLTQLESGVFEDLTPESTSDLINQSYATLAEISQNQIELMSSDKVSLNALMESSVRSIRYVLEAEDDGTETATDYSQMADDMDGGDSSETDTGDTGDDTSTSGDETGSEGGDTSTGEENETATDYDQMADEQDTSEDDSGDEEDTSDETSDDNSTDDSDSGDETEEPTESENTDVDSGETDENNNRYDNKELKNYFLLNSFLSMHETILDVLDTTSGVILPTPDANSVMGKVVKNLQSIRNFVEKFIQFHFSDSDYAFNLYYYNILISALKMNLKLLESAMKLGEAKVTKRTKKEE